VKVCYLSRGGSVHDETWIAELRKYFEVVTEPCKADIVQVGPIVPDIELKGRRLKHGYGMPLAVMSWGWDVLEPPQDGEHAVHLYRAVNAADVLICDSEVVRKELTAWREEPCKIVQFPWGVDLQQFTPAAEEWQYAMFVARAHGSGMLKEAFAKVDESCVTYSDYPHESMPVLYRGQLAYVSSQPSDGSSVSLLEAMACGLPVIVYDSAGNREWVTRENGWLCNSVDSFAAAIIETARMSPADRKRMGDANRAVVEARADWHKNFLKLVEVYHGLGK
jgi:hypothetical protein